MLLLCLLMLVNLCSAAYGMNARQVVMISAVLQAALTPGAEHIMPEQAALGSVPTPIEFEQAALRDVPKPIKREPSKHKVNKMYIPNTKPNTYYRRQSRSKH